MSAKRLELLAQAKKAARAAGGDGHPIKELSGILIETDGRDGVIRLTATNLEVTIRATLPAIIERDGNAIIDPRLLLSVLNKLPGDDVYMELRENGQLCVIGGKPRFSIAVLNGENYPKVDIPYPGDTVSVKGIKTLINSSVFAAATTDPSRPVMSCVNMIFSGDGVRAIGCDGYCAVSVKGDPESKGDISILVPAKSLKLLEKIISDDDVYELGITGTGGAVKNVVFSDGTMIFSTRLIEGKYLDTDTLFKSLVPEATARTDAKKLYKALDNVVSLVSGSDRIEFSFGDTGLNLRCESDGGTANCALEADIVSASTEKYYYFPKNLMACANALTGSITLNFTRDKMLEIRSDSIRFFQNAARPAPKSEPAPKQQTKKPRKKAAA